MNFFWNDDIAVFSLYSQALNPDLSIVDILLICSHAIKKSLRRILFVINVSFFSFQEPELLFYDLIIIGLDISNCLSQHY